MQYLLRFATPLWLLTALYACQSSSSNPSDHSATTGTTATNSTATAQTDYPPISIDQLQAIAAQVQNADYIFLQQSFTLNTSGNDARQNVGYIGTEPVANFNNCQPTARVDFTGPSGIICQAYAYYGNGCNYYVVKYQGHQYANRMHPNGVNFFGQILQRAKVAGEQGPPAGH